MKKTSLIVFIFCTTSIFAMQLEPDDSNDHVLIDMDSFDSSSTELPPAYPHLKQEIPEPEPEESMLYIENEFQEFYERVQKSGGFRLWKQKNVNPTTEEWESRDEELMELVQEIENNYSVEAYDPTELPLYLNEENTKKPMGNYLILKPKTKQTDISKLLKSQRFSAYILKKDIPTTKQYNELAEAYRRGRRDILCSCYTRWAACGLTTAGCSLISLAVWAIATHSPGFG